MLEIKVTVEIPGLMELARAIAGVTAGQTQVTQPVQPVQTQPAQPVQTQPAQPVQTQPAQPVQTQPAQPVQAHQQQYNQTPIAPSVPTQQSQAPTQSVPVQQPYTQQFAPASVPQPGLQTAPAAPPTAVPTTHTTQQYTQDQMAIAMTQLMDAGKVDVVMGIMQQFGAQTLMQIPKDRYPELAVILRQAGAQI